MKPQPPYDLYERLYLLMKECWINVYEDEIGYPNSTLESAEANQVRAKRVGIKVLYRIHVRLRE